MSLYSYRNKGHSLIYRIRRMWALAVNSEMRWSALTEVGMAHPYDLDRRDYNELAPTLVSYHEADARDAEVMRTLPKVRAALPTDSPAYHWVRAFQGWAEDTEPVTRALASSLGQRMELGA